MTPVRSSGAVPGGPVTTSRASSIPSRILRQGMRRTGIEGSRHEQTGWSGARPLGAFLELRRRSRDRVAMPSWSDFEAAAPELAARVRDRLDAHTHKTLATVRADGSPRISGTETQISDGEIWIGSMWQARKAHDLQRDPRFAIHSGSDDPPDWGGDAKLAGVAVEIVDPDEVR